jgi:hypothetical protein
MQLRSTHLHKPIRCSPALLTAGTSTIRIATLLLLLLCWRCLPCSFNLRIRLIQEQVEEELRLLSALTHHLDLVTYTDEMWCDVMGAPTKK